MILCNYIISSSMRLCRFIVNETMRLCTCKVNKDMRLCNYIGSLTMKIHCLMNNKLYLNILRDLFNEVENMRLLLLYRIIICCNENIEAQTLNYTSHQRRSHYFGVYFVFIQELYFVLI